MLDSMKIYGTVEEGVREVLNLMDGSAASFRYSPDRRATMSIVEDELVVDEDV